MRLADSSEKLERYILRCLVVGSCVNDSGHWLHYATGDDAMMAHWYAY